MVKGNNKLTKERLPYKYNDYSKDRKISPSQSESRSKSIPQPEKLEEEPETLNILPVNKPKIQGILKKTDSVKRIGSSKLLDLKYNRHGF